MNTLARNNSLKQNSRWNRDSAPASKKLFKNSNNKFENAEKKKINPEYETLEKFVVKKKDEYNSLLKELKNMQSPGYCFRPDFKDTLEQQDPLERLWSLPNIIKDIENELVENEKKLKDMKKYLD